MNLHTADVTSKLERYLARRQVPKHLAASASAMLDETRALAEAVERNAPRGADALSAWWPKFEYELGMNGRGFWPTEREIADAARTVNTEAAKARQSGPSSAPTIDAAEVVSRKMADGKAVSEGWLYGRNAVELIQRRLVNLDTMTRYRSAAFFSRKELHGEEAALAWEIEAKERHEGAKAMLKDTERRQHSAPIPNKTSKPRDAA